MTVQLQQVGVQYWFRVLLTVLFCISSVWFGIHQSYSWLGVSLCLLVLSILWQIRLYRLHTKQVLFMIDARIMIIHFILPKKTVLPKAKK